MESKSESSFSAPTTPSRSTSLSSGRSMDSWWSSRSLTCAVDVPPRYGKYLVIDPFLGKYCDFHSTLWPDEASFVWNCGLIIKPKNYTNFLFLGTILKFADDSKGGIPPELRIMIWVLAFPWLNVLNKLFLNTEDYLQIQKIDKTPRDYHPRPSSLRFCKVQGIVEKYARVAGS
ncbi:hypothetical protein L207DRAFT_581384 [Hyaloscypha variabilis F]|uniref:Uncharacterized protein n=1 Tax=Hyaloscypha variabilis (strain UAMH 11265 / GT02V1 / F) TaxID=1149755 RepID=A0A2J6RW39_HYAVF|nr:hypothetical protein L207DRAFT_581384 [Hyaloscypha variabilis F]